MEAARASFGTQIPFFGSLGCVFFNEFNLALIIPLWRGVLTFIIWNMVLLGIINSQKLNLLIRS